MCSYPLGWSLRRGDGPGEGGDLTETSNGDLRHLVGDALTELLRRNPLPKLLSWDMDETTITSGSRMETRLSRCCDRVLTEIL
jgi:hypothetical protein